MKQKKLIIVFIIIIMSHIAITAQDKVPPSLIKAVPGKFKVTEESYHKVAPFVYISIGMEIPTKYGCSNNKELWNPTCVGIDVKIIEDANMAKMQEDMMPFSNYLPTKDSHKPQIDTWDELIKYSETNTIELTAGRGAYYTWTRKCIQDDKDEIYGVSLTSMFGNQAVKISVNVNGNIDSSEAVAILKELHGIFSKFNFQNI